MFIETDGGRLQNLYLLQDVRVISNEDTPTTYSIGYVQMNGEIILDGKYATEAEANTKKAEIVAKLLS